jgi:PAS domain S-box-containing protein
MDQAPEVRANWFWFRGRPAAIVAGFGLGLAVLLALLVLAHRNTLALIEAADRRQHGYEVTAEIRAVLGGAVDGEAGARGFVLAGDDALLEPYRTARRYLPAHIEALRGLIADNPAQRQRLVSLEPLLARRMRLTDELVGLQGAAGWAPSASAKIAEGKAAMDALRVALGEMEAEESRLIAQRDAAVQQRSRRVEATLLGGGCIGALLIAGSFTAFSSEVRQRRAAEASLRAKTHLLESVLDSMVDGVAVAGFDGELTLFNKGAEAILGQGPGGRADEWSERYGAFELDELTPFPAEKHPLARALKGETVRDIETFVRTAQHADGIVISINAVPQFDTEGRIAGGVAVFRDVTHRKRAEQALRVAKEAAEQARDEADQARGAAELAVKELEAFSYSVSHDLRAPLRGIDGFSQAVLEDYAEALDARGRGYLERIRAGAQRMGLLIDDLLKLARVSRASLRRERVDVTALANDVAAEVRTGEPNHSVRIRVEEGLAVDADPQLLRVALENLISNAWKFTRRKAEAVVEIGMSPTDGRRVFFVRDNGAGFDMAYADKLFGPFQRLHAVTDFEGTGIGLATVQRVVHRHGGRIWAHGAVDAGATFYFTLEAHAGAHPERGGNAG